MQFGGGEFLQVGEADAGELFAQYEAALLDVDDRERSVDAGYAADASERKAAALDQLGLAVFGEMLGDYCYALGAVHQVHGATDCGHAFAADAPIRQVAILRNLVGAEDGNVEMAAAHHGEAVGVMKEGGSGFERYRLFTSVDQVPVFAAGFGRGAEAEYAVLSVVDGFATWALEFGYQLREADAEVDVGAVFNVLRGAPGDLRVAQFVH